MEAVEVYKGAAAASVEASTMFPGFKFSPTDVELISYYLKRKMDGLERSVEVIPEVIICNFEPWDLPDKSIIKSDTEWFFFCPRGRKYPHGSQNRRATKMGYWKATGKERDVKSSSEVIGIKRTLVFHLGRAPKGERTEWIMHEYGMKGVSMGDAMVVCRIRRNIEFHSCTNQKVPKPPNAAAEKHTVVQNGAGSPTDLDNVFDFYLAGESGEKLLSEMAETANNLQVETEEDFFADILRDEIINLEEAMMAGMNTPNEVSSLESASMDTRVLPLPSMIEKQMTQLLEDIQPSSQEKDNGKGKSNEPLSSCFVGLYNIKTVNRSRWDVVIVCVLVVIAMLYYLE